MFFVHTDFAAADQDMGNNTDFAQDRHRLFATAWS